MIRRLAVLLILVIACLSSIGAQAFFANHGILLSGGRLGPIPTVISPLSASVADSTTNNTVIVSSFAVTMSDSSIFAGTITDNDSGGFTKMVGNSLAAAKNYAAGDDGAHTFTLTACQGGRCLTPQTFTLTINAQGATPAAAAAAGFTQHPLHMDFTDPFYGNQANWLADCGANPTAAGPGAHGFLWRGWVGFGPGSKAQCSDFTQQPDPIDGKLSLRMIINNNELSANSCSFLNPPVCPLGLIETTDVDGNCHTNGAFCANYYYNEIVARIENLTNTDGIYDFWTVQCPETDGQESSPPGSNSQGSIATSHVDLCSSIGSNANGFYQMNRNNTLDMSKYYKQAWRLTSSGGAFANAGCGGAGGDNTHMGIAGYVTQNVTQDPVKLNTDAGTVCVPTQALIDGTNDGNGNPGGADNGMGSGGGGGIQIDNVARDFQLNTGGPTRVLWVRSIDSWVHPNWSATNQRASNSFSPSQQPNP